MLSPGSKLEETRPILPLRHSPPSTPPGFTKYYTQQRPTEILNPYQPQRPLVMTPGDEEEKGEEMQIPTPHADRSHSEFGEAPMNVAYLVDRRRFNAICAFILALLSLLLVLSFLVQLAAFRDTYQDTYQTSSFRRQPVLLFGSLLCRTWTRPVQRSFSLTTVPLHAPAEPSQSKIKRLPKCIIIGARKCGTRALIDMLNLHPQVEKASLEVHFFDRDANYDLGLEWYRTQMPYTREDQMCLEKSPSYFVTPEVPERIHAFNASIKLLLIVREPVTRIISDYTQIYGTNPKAQSGIRKSVPPPRLEDLVFLPDGSVNTQYKAIRISMYARYLQRWLAVFPLEQIHIIDGDAMIRDPFPVLKDVERFLALSPKLSRDNFYFNVSKGFYCWRKLENTTTVSVSASSGTTPNLPLTSTTSSGLYCLNDSKGRRHPAVDTRIVSKLRRFYNPHNRRLYEMVSRDFGWPEQ